MNRSNRKLTPIQVLTYEKQKLMKQCEQHEQLIGAHLNYIHQHAGSLIIQGVKSILFPSTLPNKSSASHHNVDSCLDGYLAQVKSCMPILWEVVRPVLISWGMTKFRQHLNMLLRKL